MNKCLLLVLALAVTGCSALGGAKDTRTWTQLRCSGGSADWTDCWAEAKKLCPNGYDTANKEENRSSLKREIEVACKP